MSTSVPVAIAGLMVTAVGTGVLGGRCIRSPRPSFIAWAIGMFALTVALLGQSIGFATGFSAVTFRVVQVSAQLVAPVALAWGLVELVARGPAARFGARLAAAGLVVVVGVILATDPLAAKAFGPVWPSAAVHYQLIPHYALIGLHLAVVAVAAAAVALCAARDRGRPADGQLLPGAAAVGGAVVCAVALRFGLPADAAYPALTAVSGGLVWFGMTRADGPASGAARSRALPAPTPAPGTAAGARALPPEPAMGSGRAVSGWQARGRARTLLTGPAAARSMTVPVGVPRPAGQPGRERPARRARPARPAGPARWPSLGTPRMMGLTPRMTGPRNPPPVAPARANGARAPRGPGPAPEGTGLPGRTGWPGLTGRPVRGSRRPEPAGPVRP